jgi:hypothetical protein
MTARKFVVAVLSNAQISRTEKQSEAAHSGVGWI